MSSLAPTKRERPTNTLPSRAGLGHWLKPMLTSTVGNKVLVACTGTLLTGFVLVHMIGNLQIFLGAEKLNEYAKMLKSNGAILWGARSTLLLLFVVHLTLAIRLKMRSQGARPIGYIHQMTIQATWMSRNMVLTGLTILAFVVFHIAHFTLGWVQDGNHDVYNTVIAGFQNPFLSILYLIAQGLLFLHLVHGVSSVFQTLGLNTPRSQKAVKCLGCAVASIVLIGNCAIVFAVWFRIVT